MARGLLDVATGHQHQRERHRERCQCRSKCGRVFASSSVWAFASSWQLAAIFSSCWPSSSSERSVNRATILSLHWQRLTFSSAPFQCRFTLFTSSWATGILDLSSAIYGSLLTTPSASFRSTPSSSSRSTGSVRLKSRPSTGRGAPRANSSGWWPSRGSFRLYYSLSPSLDGSTLSDLGTWVRESAPFNSSRIPFLTRHWLSVTIGLL